MNYRHFFIVFLSVIYMTSCKHQVDKPKASQAVTVDVIVAKMVNFPSKIEVNGETLAAEMVELHPEISGRLTYLNIPDGANIKAGTILAKINDADLVAQLEQQKVQLQLASKTEQRLKELLSINGINQSDYDAAVSQVNTVNANIKVLNAQIDKTIVKAPFSGKLGLRMVSPGAYVTPAMVLGTLQQSDKIKIDFTVPESYRKLVEIGNQVGIQTNESDTSQNAVISAIEPQINVETRNLKVRALVSGEKISPGTFVKVLLNKDEEGIVVPSNALIPDASSNQVVLVKKNRAVFSKVETGIRNADVVEISRGISAGDTIIVSGVLFVRPNSLVHVRTIKTQSVTASPDSNLAVR